MKKCLLILFILIGSIAFSQSKKELLTQKWRLDKVEEFGEQFSPMENQKNDWIHFSNDGKFIAIIESNHVEGTWSENGYKITLSVDKKLSKIKINWTKVIIIERGKFALKYQNGDLITATMIFVPINN